MIVQDFGPRQTAIGAYGLIPRGQAGLLRQRLFGDIHSRAGGIQALLERFVRPLAVAQSQPVKRQVFVCDCKPSLRLIVIERILLINGNSFFSSAASLLVILFGIGRVSKSGFQICHEPAYDSDPPLHRARTLI